MPLLPTPFRYALHRGYPLGVGQNPQSVTHEPSLDLIGGDFAEYDVSAGTANAYRAPAAGHAQIALAEFVGWWIVSVQGTGLGAREHRLIQPSEIPTPATAIVVGTTVGAVANGMPLTFGTETVYLGRGATHLLLSAAQTLGAMTQVHVRRLL